MTIAANGTAGSATPDPRSLRTARLLRAGVLVLAGLAIAFTAPLHGQLGFDVALLVATHTLIAAATLVEYRVLRGTPESWWVAARAVIALAAAGSFLVAPDSATLALLLAIWAMLTGAVTAMRLVRRVQPPQVAVPSLLLSFALAVAVLLVRGDAVAIIGFFGAYALIRGVFLGITAFDPRAAREGENDARGAAAETDEN